MNIEKICNFLDELIFMVWAIIVWFSIVAIGLLSVSGILNILKG